LQQASFPSEESRKISRLRELWKFGVRDPDTLHRAIRSRRFAPAPAGPWYPSNFLTTRTGAFDLSAVDGIQLAAIQETLEEP
jgi:hypothetical protein